jgi:hypothetical protein
MSLEKFSKYCETHQEIDEKLDHLRAAVEDLLEVGLGGKGPQAAHPLAHAVGEVESDEEVANRIARRVADDDLVLPGIGRVGRIVGSAS